MSRNRQQSINGQAAVYLRRQGLSWKAIGELLAKRQGRMPAFQGTSAMRAAKRYEATQ